MKETVANIEMRKEKSVIENEEDEGELVMFADKLRKNADTIVIVAVSKVRK